VIILKEKFIKSTIILVIGGLITKVLGMIIKIVATRIIGTEGIGLYMMILPTFNLFIALCTLSFPLSIGKLVAEDNRDNKRVVFSLIPISFMINIILILIILIIAPFLSNNLLHDNRLYYPIIAIASTLPFISISSIARGYFFGKERMFPHTLSNVFEQIVRLALIIILLPKMLEHGVSAAVTMMVAVNIASELSSIIILFIFLPKKFKIKKEYFRIDHNNLKDIFAISIPTTMGRLVGSIGYFFEPILVTYCLLNVGFSNEFIVNQYGILSGYVMPLLLMPSFLSGAISNALLPVISKFYASGKLNAAKSKIKQALLFSFIIGGLSSLIFFIFPEFFLKLIYNTDQGISYLKVLAFFFVILYLQAPLAVALQAMNASKKVMMANLYGIIMKLGLIFILSKFNLGMYSLVIATCFNIVFITFLHYYDLRKLLN